MIAGRHCRLLVIRIFALRMIRDVADLSQLRQLFQKGLFNAILQSHIDHATTLTSAPKLQHRDVFVHKLNQTHHTAMRCERRIDLTL